MARKANIAKEEIIEACWHLISENTFPNIPRLSEYFKNLDGRGCSNTTLLNAISEWEEAYREQSASELSDLAESIEPCIDRFNRDLIKAVSVVLDEKIRAHEESLSLRKASLEGRSDALSEALSESQIELEQRTIENHQLKEALEEQQKTNQQLTTQNEGVLSRTRVLESDLAAMKRQLEEADAALHQAQVDLAKQDIKIELLTDANKSAQSQIQQLQQSKTQEYDQQVKSTVLELKEIAKSLQNKGVER